MSTPIRLRVQDGAAHHLDKLPRDGQPQTCAAILAGIRDISLGERFEEPLLLFGCNADPGVAHGNVESHLLYLHIQPAAQHPDLARLESIGHFDKESSASSES